MKIAFLNFFKAESTMAYVAASLFVQLRIFEEPHHGPSQTSWQELCARVASLSASEASMSAPCLCPRSGACHLQVPHASDCQKEVRAESYQFGAELERPARDMRPPNCGN